MATDMELLEAWRAGDRTAGSRLADRHFDRLWRFFRLRVDSTEVPDLIQRTLLGAVESRDRPIRGSFSAYVLGIAKRVVMKQYAHSQRQPVIVAEGAAEPPGEDRSPTSLIAQQEQQRLLLAALRTLPLDSQLVLELSFWEDLSVQDVADVVDCAPGTVKSRVSRAKVALRQAVTRLARSQALAVSTSDNLERWAHSIRWHLGRTSGSSP